MARKNSCHFYANRDCEYFPCHTVADPDNFNCLVERLPAHTWGLRQLFPVSALTGLKFLRPERAAFPIYVTKKELSSVSLIYDAYSDFGVVGVIVFSLLLGYL